MSDWVRGQIGDLFDLVFGALRQRKKTHELATYLDFLSLTCADKNYKEC